MPTVFPPNDLLERTGAITLGLQKNKRMRELGWVGIAVGAFQFLAVAVNTEAWALISNPEGLLKLEKNWLPLASAGLLSVLVATYVRFRGWISESKEPFRYTCSIADFDVVPPRPEHASFQISPKMRYDLAERLNERIARLTFLGEQFVSAEDAGEDLSHIHVAGEVLIRRRSDQAWYVEVTPRIRMGGIKSSETLAHSIKFTIAVSRRPGEKVTMVTSRTTPDVVEPPPLEADDYEKILERVYFSIATQIYRQIRRDVEKKISLLPTIRLKAIAYLYEAEDYLTSNTLDAYDEARELFDASLRLFVGKRLWLPRPSPKRSTSQAKPASSALKVERSYSRLASRRARAKALVSRAEIGYARTLVYRRALAGMSGHRINAIFEARPVLERALLRLDHISRRIPGAQATLFDGYVTKALVSHYLNSSREARMALDRARSVDPARAERDSAFLFAVGITEIQPRQALPFLRLAMEEDPRFEVAQFELALKTEHIWRMRPELEVSIAEKIVAEEYMEVLKIDPGNVLAWASLGYVYWLLDHHPAKAEDAFLRGREYKEIRRTTYVAELDHSLARLYAESGDFERAYKYYLSSVSAHIAQGVDHQSQTSAQFYFFDFIGDAMLRRFVKFKDRVVQFADEKIAEEDGRVTRRMCDSVAAFALNDCGEAHRDYYSRTGAEDALKAARDLFEQAKDRNPSYVMPHFNLYLLESHHMVRSKSSDMNEHNRSALEHLDKVVRLEPRWPDAVLARVFTGLRAAQRAEEEFRRFGQIDPRSRHTRRLSVRGRSPSMAPVAGDDGRQLQSTLLDATSTAADIKEIRRLTPHDWLWEDETTFNWRALSGPPAWQGRWEREINDINVRALFSWGAGQYLRKRVIDGDESSGAPVAPDRRLHQLLLTIRDRFWPADFWLLRICKDIPDSGVSKDELKDVIRSWLREDPSAYWALTLMLQEQWTDGEGVHQPLFKDDEKVAYLCRGGLERALPAPLYAWIADQLAHLEALSRAAEVYERAACAATDPAAMTRAGRKLEGMGERAKAGGAYRRVLQRSSEAQLSTLSQAVRGIVRTAPGKKTSGAMVLRAGPEDLDAWRTTAVRRFVELGAGEGVLETVRKWLVLEDQAVSHPIAIDDQKNALRELALAVRRPPRMRVTVREDDGASGVHGQAEKS